MKILGIESSCDETAAGVVENGKTILSHVVYSQIKDHHPFGGVVPELASRKHLESISLVVEKALLEAGVHAKELGAIAVTRGPGLVGALLVGFSFAKAMGHALSIPVIGVNHLDGHLHSLLLMEESPVFPFVCLLASGGHTAIYLVKSEDETFLMGQTRDDAAGEAYDKVAKMLGLGYPGGQVIDLLAEKGDPARIRFPRVYLYEGNNKKDHPARFDFSFSGIKTAVLRYIQENPSPCPEETAHIAAGFQQAVVEVLSDKLIDAATFYGLKSVAIAGGVAANSGLRKILLEKAEPRGIRVFVPPISLCGDNAAMIAKAGYSKYRQKDFLALDQDVYSRIPPSTGAK